MPLTPEQFSKLVTKEYLKECLDDRMKDVATKTDVDKILAAVDVSPKNIKILKLNWRPI